MADSQAVSRPSPRRPLTEQERADIEALRAKLAPGGEYAVKAARRVEAREQRQAAIMKLIEGR